MPGEFHEQRSLAGYSPWGCKESDTTEAPEHAPCALTFAKRIGLMLSALVTHTQMTITRQRAARKLAEGAPV